MVNNRSSGHLKLEKQTKNTKPDENLKYVLCDKHKKSLLKMSKGLSESVNRRNTAEIHMN